MTLAGRGEQATTTYVVWRDGRYKGQGEVSVPHSLGLLCGQVAAHLALLEPSDTDKVTC